VDRARDLSPNGALNGPELRKRPSQRNTWLSREKCQRGSNFPASVLDILYFSSTARQGNVTPRNRKAGIYGKIQTESLTDRNGLDAGVGGDPDGDSCGSVEQKGHGTHETRRRSGGLGRATVAGIGPGGGGGGRLISAFRREGTHTWEK